MSAIVKDPSPVDAAKVGRALRLLVEPGSTFELRALPSRRNWFGKDVEAATVAAISLGRRDNLYYTLNPCRPDLDGPAKNADVLARRWILVDCDSRHGDRPASPAEREAAWRVAEAVRADLTGRGWPRPVVVDSGNGFQLLYRCELDNSPLAAQWVANLLRNLGARHSDDLARVDDSVHNAGRIARLPGTWNVKGTPDPEEIRIHRPADFLDVPDPVGLVPAELIRAAAERPRAVEPPRPRIRLHTPRDDGAGRWFAKALEKSAARVAGAAVGTRHNAVRAEARALAGLVHHGLVTAADVVHAMKGAALAAGLDAREADEVIAWAVADGQGHPLPWPEGLARPPERETPPPGAPGDPGGGGAGEVPAPAYSFRGNSGASYDFPLVVRGSDITPRRVEWLWPDRIPFGFITLMAGRTSVGKSFLTLDVAARVTTGEEIPECGGECFEPANVLVISEDSPEYVVSPRLLEAGADMNRANVLSLEAMAVYSLADTRMLDDAYHAAGCPRMVVIDPPTNFLGGKDEHKNAEVRGVLMLVTNWAMSHGVAVVLITHCNKGTRKDLAALDRIMGSVAWASTSRIAHLFALHPERDDAAVFLPLKNNLGRMARGLAYRVAPTATLARVEWLGPVDLDADEAVSGGGERRPRGQDAVAWLTERFRERPEWPSKELVRLASEAGISRNALWSDEAKALPLRRRHVAAPEGGHHWVWTSMGGWPI